MSAKILSKRIIGIPAMPLFSAKNSAGLLVCSLEAETAALGGMVEAPLQSESSVPGAGKDLARF